MKILTATQTRELDAYTIAHEPITHLDLMERASGVFTEWLTEHLPNRTLPVHVYCGPGNNGGDGLAVARMLHHQSYEVEVVLCQISDNTTDSHRQNLARLPSGITVHRLEKGGAWPDVPPGSIVIDAIFGSGLSRPVKGYWSKLLQHLNQQRVTRIAIDLPSGLFADRPTETTSFRAHRTLAFELPKLAFMLPENAERVGEWSVQSIGLHRDKLAALETPYHYTGRATAQSLLRPRPKYGHKGTFGHALLLAGGHGKMGAAVLTAGAALRSGAGLLTAHVPACGYDILQISIPEAMTTVDEHQERLTQLPEELSRYQAIGIGPGIGTEKETRQVLKQLLLFAEQPLVLDADALNILAQKPKWLRHLPAGSILTPHPKEFDRLFGPSAHHYGRLQLLREQAQELGVCIVLKGAHTAVALPSGQVHFNSTGNPGMGTGGMGDVLTGIILGLLAQGYVPKTAALLGVYTHGLAADQVAEEIGQPALLPSDVVDGLGRAMQSLQEQLIG